MKYRKTLCCDPDRLFGVMWGFQLVDLRKKYFECIHCKKLHETKLYCENNIHKLSSVGFNIK